jgi:hypothetical protein
MDETRAHAIHPKAFLGHLAGLIAPPQRVDMQLVEGDRQHGHAARRVKRE